MTHKIFAACLQTTASSDLLSNLEHIEPMILEARGRGAQLITLPENTDIMVTTSQAHMAWHESDHPALPFFKSMAVKTGTWILVGSLAIKADQDKSYNRSYLIAPDGSMSATYDKIHLFDATVGPGETYRESKHTRPGNKAVCVPTPFGKIGMTICYDLRFPQLYRVLAQAGCDIITVPAAFTVPTGQMHWHVLLRARAIETSCFIVAPGQCGIHNGSRHTFGHSLIISPTGEILAEAGHEPGIIYAELDLDLVTKTRQALPSLSHDRVFTLA